MSLLTSVTVAIGFICVLVPAVNAQAVFQMQCDQYSDICDNACFASSCHGILDNAQLHFDSGSDTTFPQGNTVSTADYRRQAIGCGGSNYCSGTGKDCDEFPYASTYDGGLGCLPDRYPGTDTLQQSGVTLCADASQNRRQGQALGQFYQGLNNGDIYILSLVNIQPNTLCDNLQTTPNSCPDENAQFGFRFVSTPQSSFCPARGNTKRAVISDLKARSNATTATSGRVFRTYKTNKGSEGVFLPGMGVEGIKLGDKVWTHDADMNGLEETIVEIK